MFLSIGNTQKILVVQSKLIPWISRNVSLEEMLSIKLRVILHPQFVTFTTPFLHPVRCLLEDVAFVSTHVMFSASDTGQP